MPRLTAPQARTIADAEAKVSAAKAALETAKDEREKVRSRYRDRVPIGELVTAGGVQIKRRSQRSGPSFRIAAFLKDNKLTQAMRPFFSDGTPYEVWDVKPTGS